MPVFRFASISPTITVAVFTEGEGTGASPLTLKAEIRHNSGAVLSSTVIDVALNPSTAPAAQIFDAVEVVGLRGGGFAVVYEKISSPLPPTSTTRSLIVATYDSVSRPLGRQIVDSTSADRLDSPPPQTEPAIAELA